MKFADPKNDVAFRKIFGSENKKEILISFLNNLLGFNETDKEIMEISIQNPYQTPKLEQLKETILDIMAVDKRNIHYIVEMQVFHSPAFEKRVQYYVSKAYSQQLDRSEDYPRLNQVIFLGFLDFILFKEVPGYTSRHLLLEETTNGHYFKDFSLNFVELPKFGLKLEELTNVKDKWIYFVKNAGNMSLVPPEMQAPVELKEAFEVANRMTWSREELDAYDRRGIYIQDERGRIEGAHLEGKRIGFDEGKKEGFDEGERARSLAIARKMMEDGFDHQVICRITGLSSADLNETG